MSTKEPKCTNCGGTGMVDIACPDNQPGCAVGHRGHCLACKLDSRKEIDYSAERMKRLKRALRSATAKLAGVKKDRIALRKALRAIARGSGRGPKELSYAQIGGIATCALIASEVSK